MTFVLATKNSGKLEEMRAVLSGMGHGLIPCSEAGADAEVDETGDTFRENALLKARAACGATGLPAIADDSGLCVGALNGEPGVYSKRYAGEGADDGGRCDFLLKKLENTEHRSAKFVSNIVCVFTNGDVVEASGECRGEILREKRGGGGFGYDPVFYIPELGRSMAELMPAEKNAVSHRGAALRAFAPKLEAYLRGGGAMKTGIYGGAFNPPHTGHVRLAEAAMERLGLDRLIVVPTGEPPHKRLPGVSPDALTRLALTRLAFADLPRADVSGCEAERAGVSYTADTVRRFRREYPGDEIYLLTGADMFLSIMDWKDSDDILRGVIPAAGARRGGDARSIRGAADDIERKYGVTPEIVEFEPVDVSSSHIRDALKNGGGREYLAESVYACIIRKGLYGARPELAWLRERAYAMLDDSRVAHVEGCELEAARLADRWGADERSAREAAILHDITKRLDADGQLAMCERYGVRADEIEREYPRLLHAKTGAAFARAEFAVSDAVYDAILWHTTGRADMALLEKIMYIADYIEPTRDFEDVDALRELAYSDLDAAVICGLDFSITDITSRGITPHPHSLEALRFLRPGEQTNLKGI
jgi:nicotinate-nucleotide adenylyltransferase